MCKLRRVSIIILVAAIIVSLHPGNPDARWMIYDTGYVSIWYKSEEALETLFKRVHITSLDKAVLSLFVESKYSKERLRAGIDGLFDRVGEVLEVSTEGLKVKMKVYETKRSMNAEVCPLREKKGIAFYDPCRKIIYVSLDWADASVLAHEFTHALMDHYFDKPVPVLVDELVAKYIEENLY